MARTKNRIEIDLTGDTPPRNEVSRSHDVTGGRSSIPKLLQRMSSDQITSPKHKLKGREKGLEMARRKRKRTGTGPEDGGLPPPTALTSLAARMGLSIPVPEDPPSSDNDVVLIEQLPPSANLDSSIKTNRNRGRNEAKRARKAEESNKTASTQELKESVDNQADLLFVTDLIPNVVDSKILASFTPPSLLAPTTTPILTQSKSTDLILPRHVRVADDTIEEQTSLPQPTPTIEHKDSDESDIEWLDDIVDNTQGGGRYFAKQTLASYQNCRLCGEGGHKEKDCTRTLCLTCGALDEHETRSCPIPLTCFNCGGRGHISSNCSAPRQRRGCNRCGSTVHQTNNCPTLWRIYTYNSARRRDAILEERNSARGKPFLEGGELYLGDDIWCYCCGEDGHWGDDCTERWRPIKEPTIFSQTAMMTGPFANDRGDDYRPSRDRRQRRWERPMHPGRDGRERQKQRSQALRYEEEDEDGADWFSLQYQRARGDVQSSRGEKERSSRQEREHIVARDIDRFRERHPEIDRRRSDSTAARSSQQNGSTSRSIYPSRPNGETTRREGRDKMELHSHDRRRDRERERDSHHDDGGRSRKGDGNGGPHYRGGYGR